MHRSALLAVCVAAAMVAGVALKAQDAGKMVFAPAATSKFQNMPGIPKCLTILVERGDPTTGPAIMLLKMTAGCKVPWHWHTVGEQVMVVSGVGKAEMKGMDKAAMVHAGDFLYIPAKNIHQLTAVTAMTLFNAPKERSISITRTGTETRYLLTRHWERWRNHGDWLRQSRE
jgi:quercetin dioxygenase-like cupin family protein